MSAAAANQPCFAVLMRPCIDCERQVLLADWNLQLGHCEHCARARQFEAAAASAHILPARGAGVPTAPRPIAALNPQQRLAAGIPGKPAPRDVILQLGEMERRRRRRKFIDRLVTAIALVCAISAGAMLTVALAAWWLLP